jgi:hypothetical protein
MGIHKTTTKDSNHESGKKVTLKLSLVLIKHHSMKYVGVEVQLHSFLTSEPDGGEWSALRSVCFTPREIATGIHCIRGWVGPRAGMDAITERNISCPRRESNPGGPGRRTVATGALTELPGS